MYKRRRHSVGNNIKHFQIAPKYRFRMMKKDHVKNYCEIAIAEACKKYKIEILILKILPDHVPMSVDVPRTITDANLAQIVKGFSSYLLFRICPQLRRRYPKGNFWSAGYFCESVGIKDFESVYKYIQNQEAHHGLLVIKKGRETLRAEEATLRRSGFFARRQKVAEGNPSGRGGCHKNNFYFREMKINYSIFPTTLKPLSGLYADILQ